jgi:hypothetical protein
VICADQTLYRVGMSRGNVFLDALRPVVPLRSWPWLWAARVALLSPSRQACLDCPSIKFCREISLTRHVRMCVNTESTEHAKNSSCRRIFEKSPRLLEKGGVLIFSPGLYGGLYGQNLLYKFKNSYRDFRNHNFENSHRTTGPRSDLRPDS